MLVGSIDQVMLSKYNATAVAAVGNANQIMNTLILSLNVISLAATIITGYCVGEQGFDKTDRQNWHILKVFVSNSV